MKFLSSRLFLHIVIALAAVVPAGYYVARELQIAGTLGFPLDDSWIHLVFARNIAAGDFFSYNPHQHVAGSTSPLWTLVLAFGYFFTHSPVVMPKILGVLLNVGTGFVIFRFVSYAGLNDVCSALAAVLVVTVSRLVWASLSGMEVSLYVFLTLCSLYWYIQISPDRSWKNYRAIVTAALAASARPELLLLPVFYFLHQMALRWKSAPRRPSDAQRAVERAGIPELDSTGLLKQAGVYVVCLVPFFALNLSLSGYFFPLTFTVKAAAGAAGVGGAGAVSGLSRIFGRLVGALWFANRNGFIWLWAQDNIALAVITAGLLAVEVISWIRHGAHSRVEGVLLLFAMMILLFNPIAAAVSGNSNMGQNGRYEAQLTVMMILFGVLALYRYCGPLATAHPRVAIFTVAALCIGSLLVYYNAPGIFGTGHLTPWVNWDMSFLHQRTGSDVILYAALIAAVTAGGMAYIRHNPAFHAILGLWCVQFLCFAIVEDLQCANEYSWNVKNINDTQVALGEWLAENAPVHTMYATNDVGAIAFFAPQDTVLDVIGLVTPEVAVARGKIPSGDEVCAWVFNKWKPRYYICFNAWFPDFVRDGTRLGLLEPANAVTIRHNITCGSPGVQSMSVYRVNPERLGAYLAATHTSLPE